MSKKIKEKDRKRCRGCREYKGFFNFSKKGYCYKCIQEGKEK